MTDNTTSTGIALAIDHLVILVADLEQAIADYGALGFTVQRGGSHAAGSTHNALVGFGDGSYLELISFLRPDPQHRWGGWAAVGHQGFVDFALIPPAMDKMLRDARAAGLEYRGPLEGGRTRPDGALLRWQIATPPSRDLPFLCTDLSPRSLRVREGAVRQHANGVSAIHTITVQVDDLPASVSRYRALLGCDPLPAHGEPSTAQAEFSVGRSRLRLLAGGGGQGLVGLTLQGPADRQWPLDKTQGAAIAVTASAGAGAVG